MQHTVSYLYISMGSPAGCPLIWSGQIAPEARAIEYIGDVLHHHAALGIVLVFGI